MNNLDFQATTYPNGKFESQTMCNEAKTDGFRVYWYESGQIKSAAEYKYGKPDGLYTAWHENGNKSAEINYLNGHRHGVCTLWHKDGSKRLGVAYINGKMDGLWVSWHKTGQIRHAILFENYRKISKTTWHDNGSIKLSLEYGETRRYQDFSNIYIYEPDFDCPIFGKDSRIAEKRYWPIAWSWRDKNGQKKCEHLYYGYDSSVIYWHENGQKSMEVGREKGDPNIHWDDNGIKEYEEIFNFDEDAYYAINLKFFNGNEQHVITVNEIGQYDDFLEWEFFDASNNKIYKYKHDNSKDISITDDELWGIWLNSECKEFVKALKSIEKHKSVFCKIPNYN